MALKDQVLVSEHLPEFIKQAIDERVGICVNEEMDLAQKRINDRRNEVIAGVLLTVWKQLDFESNGQRTIFSVRTDDRK